MKIKFDKQEINEITLKYLYNHHEILFEQKIFDEKLNALIKQYNDRLERQSRSKK